MEICPVVADCDQMPHEMFDKYGGSLSDNNDTDDERMAHFKDVNKKHWRTSYLCC